MATAGNGISLGMIAFLAVILVILGVFISFWFRLTFSKTNMMFWGFCVVAAGIYLAVTGQLK